MSIDHIAHMFFRFFHIFLQVARAFFCHIISSHKTFFRENEYGLSYLLVKALTSHSHHMFFGDTVQKCLSKNKKNYQSLYEQFLFFSISKILTYKFCRDMITVYPNLNVMFYSFHSFIKHFLREIVFK